ncbi:MAG: preprotein translocase subunit SecB [Pelagibacterales bacterium]|nr:preprotein translocase subunit SecB [Pelagibacterales bacterium]
MKENFKIIAEFIKDMSSETSDIQTFLFVRDNIAKYQLNIDVTSKAIKDKVIEVNTTIKFEDKNEKKKKSHFEIVYASIVKIEETIIDKKIVEKIILCEVQKKIYPKLEKIFVNLLKDSGFPNISIEKKVDFDKLYNERFN